MAVYRIKYAELLSSIRSLGYDPKIYRPAEVRYEVYNILIDDIRAGETDWPVATGFSRDSFFTDGKTLENEAPYAEVLERRRGPKTYRAHPIRRYVERHLGMIVQLALDIIGAMPRRAQARAEPFSLAQAIALATLPVIPVTPFDVTFATLSAQNRRLLRAYQPLGLFGSGARLGPPR